MAIENGKSRFSSRGRWVLIGGIVLAVALGLPSIEYEIAVVAILKEVNLYVSYYAPYTPRTRVALDCDDRTRECQVSVYGNYSFWAWCHLNHVKEIEIPAKYRDYSFKIHKPDMTGQR